MNSFYFSKVNLPRAVRQGEDLRDSLRHYVTERLLKIADICLQHEEDAFRKEFGLLHKRYANMIFIVTEAVQDVNYLIKSIVTWATDDFESATTGAQRDAYGLIGAELMKIIKLHQGQ